MFKAGIYIDVQRNETDLAGGHKLFSQESRAGHTHFITGHFLW